MEANIGKKTLKNILKNIDMEYYYFIYQKINTYIKQYNEEKNFDRIGIEYFIDNMHCMKIEYKDFQKEFLDFNNKNAEMANNLRKIGIVDNNQIYIDYAEKYNDLQNLDNYNSAENYVNIYNNWFFEALDLLKENFIKEKSGRIENICENINWIKWADNNCWFDSSLMGLLVDIDPLYFYKMYYDLNDDNIKELRKYFEILLPLPNKNKREKITGTRLIEKCNQETGKFQELSLFQTILNIITKEEIPIYRINNIKFDITNTTRRLNKYVYKKIIENKKYTEDMESLINLKNIRDTHSCRFANSNMYPIIYQNHVLNDKNIFLLKNIKLDVPHGMYPYKKNINLYLKFFTISNGYHAMSIVKCGEDYYFYDGKNKIWEKISGGIYEYLTDKKINIQNRGYGDPKQPEILAVYYQKKILPRNIAYGLKYNYLIKKQQKN